MEFDSFTLKSLIESSKKGKTPNLKPIELWPITSGYDAFVGALFCPIDQYSALYHAAINGHAHLVRLYLSLFHVHSYTCHVSAGPHEKQHFTYREIYVSYGNKKKIRSVYFNVQDYDNIIRDSTDNEVLQVLSKKSYHIQDSINYINSWNAKLYSKHMNKHFRHILSMKTHHVQVNIEKKDKKKMSSKPFLNFGNDFDDYNSYDSLEENSYERDEDVHENDLIVNEVVLNDEEHEVIDELVENEKTLIQDKSHNGLEETQNDSKNFNIQNCDVAALDDVPSGGRYDANNSEAFIENADDLSFVSNFDEDDESGVVLVDEEISPSCEDNWDVLSLTQSLKNQDVNSDWDALSSVRSVKSIDTFHSEIKSFSYKHALMKKGGNVDNNQGQKLRMGTKSKTVPKEFVVAPPTFMSPVAEDSCYEEYDERDGYKYGRGGKNPYIIRGEGKVAKNVYKTKARNFRKG
jgi:hypothetical protein